MFNLNHSYTNQLTQSNHNKLQEIKLNFSKFKTYSKMMKILAITLLLSAVTVYSVRFLNLMLDKHVIKYLK